MQQYTAIIVQEDFWWTGWIEEIPGVNCQEKNLRELRKSLKECLGEILELHRADSLAAAGANYMEETIVL